MVKIIQAYYEILTPIEGADMLARIERAARTCYKSEDRITGKASAYALVQKLITAGHWAMIEHGGEISVRFVCDRGVSHELVRHRIASFAQESTRYCNYSLDKFGKELTVIAPCFFIGTPNNENEMKAYNEWYAQMVSCEQSYFHLVNFLKRSPQEARTVLPNSLKTEIVVTANLREWRHIFELRTAPAAHPQMRELMVPLLKECQSKIPLIFDNIHPEGGSS